jgi:RNA recognition motif-containing protein
MIKNIPNNMTRQMLLELLDSVGFVQRYNFVYLPMDFHRNANLGYAFVNMVSPMDAKAILKSLHGFADWKVAASDKVIETTWGYPLQGLDAHVERFRNSPVMHEMVPEDFKPLLFVDGVPTSLPAPTKQLRKPRLRTNP